MKIFWAKLYSLVEALNELIVCAGLVLLTAGLIAKEWYALWGLMLFINAMTVELAFLNPPEILTEKKPPRLRPAAVQRARKRLATVHELQPQPRARVQERKAAA